MSYPNVSQAISDCLESKVGGFTPVERVEGRFLTRVDTKRHWVGWRLKAGDLVTHTIVKNALGIVIGIDGSWTDREFTVMWSVLPGVIPSLKYNPLLNDEDIYIPRRPSGIKTGV